MLKTFFFIFSLGVATIQRELKMLEEVSIGKTCADATLVYFYSASII
jgi:hypothetical protein